MCLEYTKSHQPTKINRVGNNPVLIRWAFLRLARNYLQCLGQRGKKPYPVQHQIQHIFVTGITREFTLWKSKRALAFCSKFKDVVFPDGMVHFTLQYVSPKNMKSEFRPVSYLNPRLRGIKLKK